MDIFLKATAGVIMAVVVSLILSKNGKDYGILLIICVCSMVCLAAFSYIERIIDFIREIQQLGNISSNFIEVLLKAAGIGLLTEITVMICNDSGNTALGKVVHMLSTAVILWLCIPLFTKMMDLVSSVLNNI